MLEDKEIKQAEEFSQGLDALQQGKQPDIQDEEVKEWLKTAVLLKQSKKQEELPTALIEKMADQLSLELAVQKKKRASFRMYGTLGTAAAILIAAFLQFYPSQPYGSNLARQQENPPAPQQLAAVLDTPSPAPDKGTSNVQQNSLGKSEQIQPTRPTEGEKAQKTASLPETIAQIIKEPQEADKGKEQQVAKVEKETLEAGKNLRSLFLAKGEHGQLPEGKELHSEGAAMTVMLVLPDRQPQWVKAENGVIEQVYHMENQAEIKITQRLSGAEGEARLQNVVQPPADQGSSEKMDGLQGQRNRITLKKGQYDITIEGETTTEELQKIGELLIEREMNR